MHRPLAWLRVFVSAGLALPAFAQQSGQAILPVGEFSNMRFSAEHANGYAVQLWRNGDSLIGLLLVSEGLQGDTPTGLLENVGFDSHSGKLTFTSRLTTGLMYVDGHQEPSRDLFMFTGILGSRTLTGTLKRTSLLVPSNSNMPERIQLKVQPDAVLFSAGSYSDWKNQVDEILKRRGPKW
jgi:hypothetical protein